MRIASLSMIALMMSAGMAAAQAPVPPAGGGAEFRAGEGRRQQDGGAERLERRERRLEERTQRQDVQPERAERGGVREERVERRPGDRDGRDRFEGRSRESVERRVIVREREPSIVVRERGPSVRYGVGPDVYIRTLPVQYRTVVYGGRRCRVTITRRVRANGRIVTTETRKCPGRPTVVIRTRR